MKTLYLWRTSVEGRWRFVITHQQQAAWIELKLIMSCREGPAVLMRVLREERTQDADQENSRNSPV